MRVVSGRMVGVAFEMCVWLAPESRIYFIRWKFSWIVVDWITCISSPGGRPGWPFGPWRGGGFAGGVRCWSRAGGRTLWWCCPQRRFGGLVRVLKCGGLVLIVSLGEVCPQWVVLICWRGLRPRWRPRERGRGSRLISLVVFVRSPWEPGVVWDCRGVRWAWTALGR